MYQIVIKTNTISVYKLAYRCTSIVCLVALTAAAYANTDNADTGDADVDSVYSWGIWELGLEPASGPQAPASHAINDRSRSLKFRPNDNAAYMVQSIPVTQAVTTSPQPPAPQPPPPTPRAPVAPPMPIGPPGFSSGPITTADPRN